MAPEQPGGEKAPDAFRTISEVADELRLPQHVLRFWETRFAQIRPLKRGGGRRYYRPDDVELLRGIRHLLYGEGYTIRGVQRILKEQGIKFVQAVWKPDAPQPSRVASDFEQADEGAAPEQADEAPFAPSADAEHGGPAQPPLAEAAQVPARPPTAAALGQGREQVTAAPDRNASASVRGVRQDAVADPVSPQEPANADAHTDRRLAPQEMRLLQTAHDELLECRRLLTASLKEIG